MSLNNIAGFLGKHKYLMALAVPILQSPLIIYIASRDIQSDLKGHFSLNVPILAIIIGLLSIVWLVGYLYWKLGLLGEEQRFALRNNPEWLGKMKDDDS
jgi:hypothetical protein